MYLKDSGQGPSSIQTLPDMPAVSLGLQWQIDKNASLKASLSLGAAAASAVSFLVFRGTKCPQVCWGNLLSVLQSLKTHRGPGCGPALASSTSGS